MAVSGRRPCMLRRQSHHRDFYIFKIIAGAKCNVENIPAQWDTLKNRVKHIVSGLKDVNYLEVWAKLLTNKSVKEDCSDVLHVIELLLITPFTNEMQKWKGCLAE